jgi:ribose transport system substrate-binding protein
MVELVAKGFQHQFWTTVKKGADAAAADLGVTINFVGPASESAVDEQVNQLNAALSKNPSAIALAALDTESVVSQLNQAKEAGIPVVGFDSGVPDAPEGTIVATASTDNKAAAALAAEKMMENADFKAAVEAATVDAPITIGVASQDATSTSVTYRTEGFIAKMKELVEAIHPGGVEVTGHSLYEEPATGDVVVTIQASIPPTTNDSDLKNAAEALLNVDNIVGIFCSNEGAVGGMLNATTDGSDLGDGGRYDGLIVAGFDAGIAQKNAVREGWFIGSVTQDPFQIGYQAVELATKAAQGESVADVDTGAKWYDATNIDDEDIELLVYD